MSHRFNFIDGTNGSIGQNSGIPTPKDMKNEEKLKGRNRNLAIILIIVALIWYKLSMVLLWSH